MYAAGGYARAPVIVRAGIYIISILCFMGSLMYLAQGFLYTVNRFLMLWNLRFGTEFVRFSVNSAAAPGLMIFWCLLSVPLAFFVQMLMRRQRAGRTSDTDMYCAD